MNDATVKFGFDGADLKIGLAEAERRIKRAASNMDGAIRTVADAYQNEQAKAKQVQTVNPWASNTTAAKQYAQIVETRVVSSINQAAAAQQAAADKATRAKFLGSSMGSEFDTNSILAREGRGSRASSPASAQNAMRRGNFQLGMMAMQFQDIAVQAQMGARWSTIIAQQGSQMLSAFGAGGAIFGGVVAIGGAFYTLGEKSKQAFEDAKLGAQEFDTAMQKALSGSVGDITGAVEKLAARSKDLGKEWQQIATGSIMPALEEMVGGASVEDRVNQNAEQQRKALEYRRELGKALADASAQETQVATLRAAGNTEQADALEKEIKLKRELTAISELQVDGHIREKLAADAVTKSGLDMEAVAKARAEVLRIEEKLTAEKLRQLDPVERYLELSSQQEAALAKMAEQGGMFFEQSKEGLEAWSKALKESGDVETLAKAMKIMEESTDLQNQMAEAEREITMQRDKRDADADKKREQDKAEQSKLQEQAAKEWETLSLQEQGKRNIREEIMLLEAKAAGQTDLVNRMERELRIREKTKEIEAQTGINPAQARKSAEQIIGLEDAAEQQAAASARMPRRMMGGIDEGPISMRGGYGRGRMMGAPDAGPISLRLPRSTTNPDLSRAATPASGGDVGTKLDKTNNLLERVFFAAS